MASDMLLSPGYLMAYSRSPLVDLQFFMAQMPDPVVSNLAQLVEDALAKQGLPLDRETLRSKVIPELEQAICEAEARQQGNSLHQRINSLLDLQVNVRLPWFSSHGVRDNLPHRGTTLSKDRNGWLFDLWISGKSLKEIRISLFRVADERQWEVLSSDQAVHTAIKRWCTKRNITMPRRKGRTSQATVHES
jgi:hypothetical protein